MRNKKGPPGVLLKAGACRYKLNVALVQLVVAVVFDDFVDVGVHTVRSLYNNSSFIIETKQPPMGTI